MKHPQHKVVHIISSMQLGGVQKAIALSAPILNQQIDYRVLTLSSLNPFLPINSSVYYFVPKRKYIFLNTLSIFKYLNQTKPDVIVVSLWKSVGVCLVYKFLFNQHVKVIGFLHSEKFFHWLDKFFLKLVLKNANALAYDSKATQNALRRYTSPTIQGFVIPFIFKHSSNKLSSTITNQLKLLYCGRFEPNKCVDKIVAFASYLKSQKIQFEIHAYGEGRSAYIHSLEKKIVSEQLTDSIVLQPPFSFSETANIFTKYNFYIQFSEQEGMAMSVVEAMQFGLIPIVTAVGEIPQYIHHKKNGYLLPVNFDESEFENVFNWMKSVVQDVNKLKSIQQYSAQTFQNQQEYSTAFLEMIDKVHAIS